MAYDRYDRDERPRWSDESSQRGWGGDGRGRHEDRGRDERGFFERAGDEIASWFGADDDSGRGRGHHDDRDRERMHRDDRSFGGGRHEGSRRDFNEDRGVFSRGGSSERDYNRGSRDLWGSGEQDRSRGGSRGWGGGDCGRDTSEGYRGYRPMTGDYGRSETPYGRDEYRRTSFAGSRKDDRDFDPHYRNWRDRHVSDLDREYDEYRKERQQHFENDFGSWRETRQQKRGLLGQIREHMEVVGSDDEHLGTVDKVAGDRIILTKSDPESGGAHHSLSCSLIDRVEGDRVILDRTADQARQQWRDENRGRALFEREDQGEMGPGILDRSFSGTYR